MNKLNYLKNKFFENAQLGLIPRSDSLLNQKVISDFFNNLPNQLQAIAKAPDEQVFKQELKLLREKVVASLRQARKENSMLHHDLGTYFFNTNINVLDDWLKRESDFYEIKKRFNIFEKFGWKKEIEFEMPKSIIDEDVIQAAQEILNTYQLRAIDLSKVTKKEEALEFLSKIKESLEDVTEKLGVMPQALGLNKTLAINYITEHNPNYSSMIKAISLTMDSITPSTLLHEWTHALDNYVTPDVRKVTHSSYASENEGLYAKNVYETDTLHAYEALRKLTRHIMNRSPEEVQKNIDDKAYLGACKFFSLAIGSQWYAFGKEQREQLFTPMILNSVNDFLVSSKKDVDFECSDGWADIIYHVSTTGLIGAEELNKTLKENKHMILKEVYPYYEALNKNIIGEPSEYYKSSIQASWLNFPDRAKKALHLKINDLLKRPVFSINEDNLTEKDYYAQPTEMLARYFEAQVYPSVAKWVNIMSLSKIYHVKKDEHFEILKDTLITHALGKEMLKPKIVQTNEQIPLSLNSTKEHLQRIKDIRENAKMSPEAKMKTIP